MFLYITSILNEILKEKNEIIKVKCIESLLKKYYLKKICIRYLFII